MFKIGLIIEREREREIYNLELSNAISNSINSPKIQCDIKSNLDFCFQVQFIK